MSVRHGRGSRPIKLVTVLVVLGGWLAGPSLAHATMRTFVGPGSDWFTASNWSPSGVPSSSDDVIIDTGSVTVSGAAASARSLALDTGVSQSATLTASGITTRAGWPDWGV